MGKILLLLGRIDVYGNDTEKEGTTALFVFLILVAFFLFGGHMKEKTAERIEDEE